MNGPLLFFIYWFLNSLALYFLGMLFPSSVVLGTLRLTPPEAAIYAGFWLAFFVWTMWAYVLHRKVELEPFSLRFLFFFVINSLGVWLVARYAVYTGLGIISFWWAFALGAITELLQLAAWKLLGEKLKG